MIKLWYNFLYILLVFITNILDIFDIRDIEIHRLVVSHLVYVIDKLKEYNY